MAEKKKNEEQAKNEFEKRVKETKAKAIEENKKLAKESGNKLTQMLAKDGSTLVDVMDKPLVSDSTASSSGGSFGGSDEVQSVSMTVDDIRKELFDSPDVVMDKYGDHGLSKLTEMKKTSETDE